MILVAERFFSNRFLSFRIIIIIFILSRFILISSEIIFIF